MGATAHTPGPLVVSDSMSESWPFLVLDRYGSTVAQTMLKADARLYASAPDVLAFLEELSEADGLMRLVALRGKARDLLAAARGSR